MLFVMLVTLYLISITITNLVSGVTCSMSRSDRYYLFYMRRYYFLLLIQFFLRKQALELKTG